MQSLKLCLSSGTWYGSAHLDPSRQKWQEKDHVIGNFVLDIKCFRSHHQHCELHLETGNQHSSKAVVSHNETKSKEHHILGCYSFWMVFRGSSIKITSWSQDSLQFCKEVLSGRIFPHQLELVLDKGEELLQYIVPCSYPMGMNRKISFSVVLDTNKATSRMSSTAPPQSPFYQSSFRCVSNAVCMVYPEVKSSFTSL